MSDKKLYIEYRLYFNPSINQDTLHELAEQFQEHIYDEWNDESHSAALDVTDVTYEVVAEVTEPDVTEVDEQSIGKSEQMRQFAVENNLPIIEIVSRKMGTK